MEKSNITVNLNPDSNLEIPAEIESQLKPGDRYRVSFTAESTVFQNLKAGFDWEELRRRRDSLAPDPNPMTIDEICELVREVRCEKNSKRESQL